MYKELFRISVPDLLTDLLGTKEIIIYSYACCIVFGALTATIYTKWRAQKELGINHLPNTFFYFIFIMGFLGGKLFYYLERPGYFIANPKLILESFSGGFVFYGSFVCIVPYVIWYLKRSKIPVLPMLDILAVTTIIAHFFGRIGCFLGGCCYGSPTDISFGIIDAQKLALHPTQLYEATLLLAIFFVVLYVKQKKQFQGEAFLTYLILYAFCRIFLELFRGDSRGYIISGIVSHAQFIALIIIVVSSIYYKKLLIHNSKLHEN